jgi:Uncharacterized conserved protein
MVLISLAAAILCIFAPIAFPIAFSPVPITLGTFAIYICCAVLGAKKGALSVVIYIALGAIGLPVFSGFHGGFEKITGPTGGFIIGFLFCGFLTGLVADLFENKIYCYAIGMILGTILCYSFGTVWLMYQNHLNLLPALGAAVLPFLPGDAAKIVFATLIAYPVRHAVQKI